MPLISTCVAGCPTLVQLNYFKNENKLFDMNCGIFFFFKSLIQVEVEVEQFYCTIQLHFSFFLFIFSHESHTKSFTKANSSECKETGCRYGESLNLTISFSFQKDIFSNSCRYYYYYYEGKKLWYANIFNIPSIFKIAFILCTYR